MESGQGRAQDFSIEPQEGYLLARLVPGFEITPERMARAWVQLGEICRDCGVFRVLAVGEVGARRMRTTDSYENANVAAREVPGVTVACVLTGHVPDEKTDLFKIAALNRGVRVEFFVDQAEALRWLGVAAAARP